jgi:hypothetical protein
MRTLALVVVLIAVAPLFASPREVTVSQLEDLLVAAHGKSDAKLSQQLSAVTLTERLNAIRLARWQEKLPGPESRRALIVLADLSSFLSLPAADIPKTSAPGVAAQRQVIASAVKYAESTIHQLPNFSATRDTIHFEDSPPIVTVMNRDLVGTATSFGPLHAVNHSQATVLYRDGHEVDENRTAKVSTASEKGHGLTTSGEFGPILATVLVDAAHGKLAWARWEHGPNGPMAVFRFEIPKQQSHYQVKFCCASGGGGTNTIQQYSGYHGEIGIDPIDGSILRLILQADLTAQEKIARADILVEYGTVWIAGKAYICPVRSVSVAKGPISAGNRTYSGTELFSGSDMTPVSKEVMQTSLNDVAFKNYHVFRSDSRVLTNKEAASIEGDAEQDLNSRAAASMPSSPTELPPPSTAENASAIPPAETVTPSPLETEPAKAASSTENAEVEVPEIGEAGSPALPDMPDLESHGKAILRVTTRLVDVGVVALDKKGRPVTDLRAEDFEVYDNGTKQELRFFTPPGVSTARTSAGTASQPSSSEDPPVYSNHRAAQVNGPAGETDKGSSSTVILIDGGHLSFRDLTFVRAQVLRFLLGVSANERVGLYS